MDNPSTSKDRFNSSNLSMPPSRLIYLSDHFASSLRKWLRIKDHESSPISNKAAATLVVFYFFRLVYILHSPTPETSYTLALFSASSYSNIL